MRCVHKPDLQTAISGGFLIARVLQEAGLPDGLLPLLPGGPEVGRGDVHGSKRRDGGLHRDRRLSVVVWAPSRGGISKKVSLELGGKNSLIILDDADLDAAASTRAGARGCIRGRSA